MTPTTCESCGACCATQGSPPGYSAIGTPEFLCDEDAERLRRLPDEARALLLDYLTDLMAGETDGEGPCCWLDLQTKRCRFYDHRPSICRDFEVGSEACQVWRDEFGIDNHLYSLS